MDVRRLSRYLVCLALLLAPAGLQTSTAAGGAWPTLTFTAVVAGLTIPVYITHAGDGSSRLFIVEQNGRILIFKNGALLSTPFLNISSRVTCCGERGLLSVAFPPGYGGSRNHFYVYYTNVSGNLVVARYAVGGQPDVADANSEQIVLNIAHPNYANHNGGQLAFGPDGYLYVGPGDGGSGGDPPNNAQNPNTLLGKLLRIDVETGGPLTYTLPASNPYTQTAGYAPEIWATGLRNPWRFSFDRATGDLYIGDVGQGEREEINFQPAASGGGENYGWRILEGTLCYNPSSGCVPPEHYSPPVAEYSHGTNNSIGCAVSGGFVYRGAQSAFLKGIYFYGDYCSGIIWGLRPENGLWASSQLTDTTYAISTFGEDEAGNLYLADHGSGKIYRLGAVEWATYLPLVTR